jgi:excisionase family DNA binding protein
MGHLIESDYYTVAEVSAFLKLSELTIYKYIKDLQLEAVQFGGHYRIHKSSLEAFIQKHKVIKEVQKGYEQ